MEFPNLSKQCQESMCKQTDYLPLKCDCGGTFCREHFTSHCFSTGCGLPNAAPLPTSNASYQFYRCSSSGCRNGSLQELLCPKCAKHFCIGHRFHPECPEVDEKTLATKREAFAAPRRMFNVSNVPLQEQITKRIRKALQSSQNAKTASKIQLMRLKQKAVGPKTLHVLDRAFFSIIKPVDSTAKFVTIVDRTELIPDKIVMDFDVNKITPIYISKHWNLGRSIDMVCSMCSIANYNDKPEGNKAKLFRASDGYCLGDGETYMTIEELMSGDVIVDGDSLIVEYVSHEVQKYDGHMFLKLPVESEK